MAPPEDAVPTAPPTLSEAARRRLEEFRVAHETRVLTIFFSDLVGSTRLQSEVGNLRATEIVGRHQAVVREVLRGFDGREVDTQGDSFLIVFAAPSEGVRFALRMQAALRAAQREEPALPPARAGIHQGQVVVEHPSEGSKAYDVYGLQVSTAARIMDLAAGGQVLCSRAVFDDARAILTSRDLAGLAPVAWRNHGPYRFKGVADAHEVCEVGEEGLAPLAAPRASVKGWPVGAGDEELGWRPAAGVCVPATSWVLTEKLGEGGFGEVWRAENRADRSTEVFKFCFRRDRLPALKREARLLKRLRRYAHPNLVQVFDVTEGDRPPYFLEMEHVEGPTIAAWLAGDPPLAERLDVVAQVADALDVVHAAGIYHRDIKPSNVLLTRREDGVLQAKLTDFGLGAAEDEDLLRSVSASRSDGLLGTSDYIAPERRTGSPASPQSDLFSLGLTLYQVVVGDVTHALPIDWERRLPDEVVREDVRRSIAPDPAGRWRRAADLAAALRGHDVRLSRREAEAAHAAERLRAARWKRVVLGASAASFVVLGLGGVALWKWREAAHHRAEAERQRDVAEEQKRIALEGIGRLTHDVPERLAGVPGALPAVRGIVEGNLGMLDRILALDPDTPAARRAKVANHVAAGDAWRRLGDTAQAAAAYEAALALANRLAAEEPRDRDTLWQRTLALERLGDVRRRQGRTQEALALHEESLRVTRALAGEGPPGPQAHADLAGALDKVATALIDAGRTAEAEPLFAEAMIHAKARVEAAPDDPDAARAFSVAQERAGDLASALGRHDEALRAYEAGMEIARRLAERWPHRPGVRRDLSLGHDKIGIALRALGRPEEALRAHEAAQAIALELATADPENVELQRDVSIGHDRLADLLLALGRVEEARASYAKAMEIGERLAARDPANLRAQVDRTVAWMRKGNVELALGRGEEALASYRKAREIAEDCVARDPRDAEALRAVGVAQGKVGNAWLVLGKPEEAAAAYEASAQVARRQAEADPRNAVVRRDLGVALYRAMLTHAAVGDVARWRGAAGEAIDLFRGIREGAGEDPAARNDLALALAMAAEGALRFAADRAPGVTDDDTARALAWARERAALPGLGDVEGYDLLAAAALAAGARGEAEDALRKALELLGEPGEDAAKAERRRALEKRLVAIRAAGR